MTDTKLIYMVDDEADICDLVERELVSFGYQVKTCQSAQELKQLIDSKIPDLCIVDLGLPDADGTDLVKELCNLPNLGVVILSGRDSSMDRILGLELGADDYIVKPFVPRELVARINSLFRRFRKNIQEPGQTTGEPTGTATFENWQYSPSTLTLTNELGEVTELSSAEHDLLMLLLKSPKKILSRDVLLGERVSPYDRSIDVRMSRVRKKIEHNPKEPTLIKTVYGVGYILTVDVNWH